MTSRRAAVLIVSSGALMAPAPAPAPAADAERATRSAVQATVQFHRERSAAGARARAAAERVSTAAAACLEDIRAVPQDRAGVLLEFHFVSVSRALWSVDAPIFGRWIVEGLRPAADRHPTWRRERARLRANLRRADRIYAYGVDDPCPAIREWRAAAWDVKALPVAIDRFIDFLVADRHREDTRPQDRLRRLIFRYAGGRPGRRAWATIQDGVDERDARVVDLDDPVWAALHDAEHPPAQD